MILALALLAAWTAAEPLKLAAAPFGKLHIAGLITDPGMDELSGLTPSRRHSNRFWAINDSGQPALVWALNLQGQVQGHFELKNIQNIDFEDLDSFRWHGTSYLAIGDIGDNGAVRDSLVIHVVREPRKLGGSHTPAWSVRFRYPDGVFDDESLAVDVAQQRMLIVSKRTDPPVLYSLPLRPETTDIQIATRIGALEHIPNVDSDNAELSNQARFATQPTGLDLGCDGRELLLLTYASVYRYQRDRDLDWAEALAGQVPQRLALPPLAQAEAITQDLSCRMLYIGSENIPSPLIRFTRKGR